MQKFSEGGQSFVTNRVKSTLGEVPEAQQF